MKPPQHWLESTAKGDLSPEREPGDHPLMSRGLPLLPREDAALEEGTPEIALPPETARLRVEEVRGEGDLRTVTKAAGTQGRGDPSPTPGQGTHRDQGTHQEHRRPLVEPPPTAQTSHLHQE